MSRRRKLVVAYTLTALVLLWCPQIAGGSSGNPPPPPPMPMHSITAAASLPGSGTTMASEAGVGQPEADEEGQHEGRCLEPSPLEDWEVARNRVDRSEAKRERRIQEWENSTDLRLQAVAEMAREELEREGDLGKISRRCWERFDPLPCGRSGATAVCLDGRPCLIGGTDDRHVYGDVRTFRAETQDWEEEAELKDRRAFHASALHDGSVWVAGGFNGDEILSSVESLRPGAASWQPQSPLSMARMDHAMVQLEGRVYVLGGSNLAETLSRSVEVFNAELGFWEASLSLSTGRRRFTAHAFGGRIWVFGGQTIDGVSDSVESWALGETAWREEECMPTCRHSHCSIEMYNRVYIMGGVDSDGLTDTVVSLGEDGWRSDPPLDQPARSQAACMAEGMAYVMGGFGRSSEKKWRLQPGWEVLGREDDYEEMILAEEEEERRARQGNATAADRAEAEEDEVEWSGGRDEANNEEDEEDEEDGEEVVACSLRGVATSLVASYSFVGEAVEYFKGAQAPGQEEMIEGLSKVAELLHDSFNGGEGFKKFMKGEAKDLIPDASEIAKTGLFGGAGVGGGARGAGVHDAGAQSAQSTGSQDGGDGGEGDKEINSMMKRMTEVFTRAMNGLEMENANETVVESTKRRVIESLIEEQIKALRASNVSLDTLGDSEPEQAGAPPATWSLPPEMKGGKRVVRMESEEDSDAGSSFERRGEEDGGGLARGRGSRGGGRRPGKEGEDERERKLIMSRADMQRRRDRDESGGEEEEEGSDGEEDVTVGTDGIVTYSRPRRVAESEEGEEGEDVTVGLDGSITKGVSSSKLPVFASDLGEEEDISSEDEDYEDAAEAFSRGELPKEVQRLARRLKREQKEIKRDLPLRAAAEECEEDLKLKETNPREYLRGLTGGSKPMESGMTFEEKMAAPATDFEFIMNHVRAKTQTRESCPGREEVEAISNDPDLKLRYKEVMEKYVNNEPAVLSSSLPDPEDVMPSLRASNEFEGLFDEATRRRALEDNIVLPEKLDTREDIRAFLKELMAA